MRPGDRATDGRQIGDPCPGIKTLGLGAVERDACTRQTPLTNLLVLHKLGACRNPSWFYQGRVAGVAPLRYERRWSGSADATRVIDAV